LEVLILKRWMSADILTPIPRNAPPPPTLKSLFNKNIYIHRYTGLPSSQTDNFFVNYRVYNSYLITFITRMYIN
jgi:hypothetical protein